MSDDLMGRNEYARHRGCSPNAVKKAEDSARIAGAVVRDEKGGFVGIDWRKADELWARNTDPAEAAKNGKVNVPAPANDSELPLGAPSDQRSEETPLAGGKTGEDPHGYLAARADRERSAAKLAELNLLERQGELVSASDVREQAFEVFRQLRDALMAQGARMAPNVAAETDPLRVQQLIDGDNRKLLNELSRALDADAGGGTAERASATA